MFPLQLKERNKKVCTKEIALSPREISRGLIYFDFRSEQEIVLRLCLWAW